MEVAKIVPPNKKAVLKVNYCDLCGIQHCNFKTFNDHCHGKGHQDSINTLGGTAQVYEHTSPTFVRGFLETMSTCFPTRTIIPNHVYMEYLARGKNPINGYLTRWGNGCSVNGSLNRYWLDDFVTSLVEDGKIERSPEDSARIRFPREPATPRKRSITEEEQFDVSVKKMRRQLSASGKASTSRIPPADRIPSTAKITFDPPVKKMQRQLSVVSGKVAEEDGGKNVETEMQESVVEKDVQVGEKAKKVEGKAVENG